MPSSGLSPTVGNFHSREEVFVAAETLPALKMPAIDKTAVHAAMQNDVLVPFSVVFMIVAVRPYKSLTLRLQNETVESP